MSPNRLSSQSEKPLLHGRDDHSYSCTYAMERCLLRRKTVSPTLRVEVDLGGVVTFSSISFVFPSTVIRDTDLDQSPLPIAPAITYKFQKKRCVSDRATLVETIHRTARWWLGAFAQGVETNNVQITKRRPWPQLRKFQQRIADNPSEATFLLTHSSASARLCHLRQRNLPVISVGI